MWHVGREKELRCTEDFGGEARERIHLEDLGVYGGIILKWTLNRSDGRAWTNVI
jgi:hypothetical protein